jgi:fatty acid desaturase
LLAGLAAVINLLIQGSNKSIFVVLVVFILTLFLSTFFISFHADASEAIQIIFLMDEHFANRELNADNHVEFNEVIINKMKLRKGFAQKIAQLYNDSNPNSQI